MKCLQCGVENDDDRNFCMSCQAELEKEPYKNFQDTKVLTKLTVFFLSFSFIIELGDIWFAFSEIKIWQKVNNGLLYESEAHAMVNQYTGIQSYSLYFYDLVSIVTMILVLTLIYKMNKNSHALGAKNMKYSPLGSIGWYFVPIFNYFKPYYAMKEIFQTSISSKDWENIPVSRYIWFWWSSWVLMWIITLKGFKDIFKSLDESELSQSVSWFLTDFFSLISTIFLILIIREIYQYQKNNFANKTKNLK